MLNSSTITTATKKQFQLLTYNTWLIHSLLPGENPPYKSERVKGFLQQLQDSQHPIYDFIFFQELHRFGNVWPFLHFDHSPYEEMKSGIEKIYDYQVVESKAPFPCCLDSGLMIVSKYRVVTCRNYVFKNTTWRSYVTAKGVLYALVDVSSSTTTTTTLSSTTTNSRTNAISQKNNSNTLNHNNHETRENVNHDSKSNGVRKSINRDNKTIHNQNLLHLFNSHMEAFDEKKRRLQIQEMVQFIKECVKPYCEKTSENSPPKIIIAGDFNIDSIRDEMYGEMMHLLNKEIGPVKDVFGVHNNNDTSKHPSTFGGNLCLDHVLVSDNFKEMSYEIVNWTHTMEQQQRIIPLSDHSGVKVTLQ
ncbi:hypothetical protein FDP41_010791 [Naegleria fowleri]|uniref:Endonuclease/exonuclease/phosphatase domain-containing protein n=1 Tax=Naegleria fowleri TaxID=5763 RepID=A0A6A5C7G0_NAEFO|nr:uncharacterized protein FDP41_010791 [Naegleria fowleri]KAF0982812.1 hypothetical protein FDP41_010791 [Naegleria fowleri]